MPELLKRRTNIFPFVSPSASTRSKTEAAPCLSMPSSPARAPVSGNSAVNSSRLDASDRSPEDFLKTILLASSDDTLRSMLRGYLESLGYLIFSCTDAKRASQVFQNGGPIDLLLVDLHLLGGSGLELASEVTAKRSDVPAIFITAPHTDNTVLSAIGHRGWKFLNKPVLLPHLFALIQEALGPLALRPSPQRSSKSLRPARVVSFPLNKVQYAQFARTTVRQLDNSSEHGKG